MFCLRWWIPIFLLPFPSAPPAILILFIISYALWTKPCAYCSMILCALFASSCYWYAPPEFDCLDLQRDAPEAASLSSTFSSSSASKPEDPMRVAESMLAASRAMQAGSAAEDSALSGAQKDEVPSSRLSQLAARLVPQSIVREALDAGSWSLALLPDFAKEAMGLQDHPPLPGTDDSDLLGNRSAPALSQTQAASADVPSQSPAPQASAAVSSPAPRSFCWLKIPDTAAGWWEPQTRGCPLGRTAPSSTRSSRQGILSRWLPALPSLPERVFLGIPSSGVGVWLRIH